jgi:hypothetical protein
MNRRSNFWSSPETRGQKFKSRNGFKTVEVTPVAP